jgi:hypothetical protein
VTGRQHLNTDPAALAAYAARTGDLADQVRQVAARHLAGNRSVPADCFGDLGREAGVHTALSAHISDLHDTVHGVAGTVDGLGRAVGVAGDDYTADEQDKADIFRRLQG